MNITLNIVDCYSTSKCYCSSRITKTFTDTDTTLELKNNYKLSIVSQTDNTYTVIIENGSYVIIRKILKNVTTTLLLPCNNCHSISLTSA